MTVLLKTKGQWGVGLFAGGIGFGVIFCANAMGSPSRLVEDTEVKSKLTAYDEDKVTLKELTEGVSVRWAERMVDFYQENTNWITVKMKLPVSRCLCELDRFKEAAALATDYVRVYSNDWHGWRILGAANAFLTNYYPAFEAYTNAVGLGDSASVTQLGMLALQLERLDVAENMVPKILALAHSTSTDEQHRLDAIVVLLSFSLKAERRDVFIKAVNAAKGSELISRPDVRELILAGCDEFKGEGIEKIREQMKPPHTTQ